MRAICVDIDNVVARTDEVVRRAIRRLSKDQVDLSYDDVVCFDYWKCRDGRGRKIDETEWRTIHKRFTLEYLDQIEPHEGAIDGLQRIATKFEIHLATSRLDEGLDATRSWLLRYGVPHSALHPTKHREKHLIQVRFAAAIDDDREQAYLFHTTGVVAFLLAHPWNTNGDRSPLKRIRTWGEMTEQVMQLA